MKLHHCEKNSTKYIKTSSKVQDRCLFLTDPELNRSTWTANYWHLLNPTISNWQQIAAFAGYCRGTITAIIAHCKTLQVHLNCNFMHWIGRILRVQIFGLGTWIGTGIGNWIWIWIGTEIGIWIRTRIGIRIRTGLKFELGLELALGFKFELGLELELRLKLEFSWNWNWNCN